MTAADTDGSTTAGPRLSPRDFGIGHLFNSIRDAVIVADAAGRIVLWNIGATSIFGYGEEDALGRDVTMLIPRELQGQHRAGMERYRHTGRGELIDSHAVTEVPALHKDGHRLVIELMLSPIQNHVPGYSLAVIRDVTERSRMQAELEERNERLEGLNASLHAFTYVVSHDLKEPVRALDAFLEDLEADHAQSLDAEGRALLARSRSTAQRMRTLLEGLLEFSRTNLIEPEEAELVSVGAILGHEDCTTRFDRAMQERNARVTVESGPLVRASVPGLCQVLGNLVLNAVRHNDKPAPHVRIASRASAEHPGMVEVRVEDNGPGIPSATRERLQRLKLMRPATIKGGFGLMIAANAVAKMGGRIWVEDAPGGGAAVCFTLPGE